ncbi:transcriptional regulator [Calothrix sp. HK-06]|nr:transcriptional regulator [Calothrix sp. HK-06]
MKIPKSLINDQQRIGEFIREIRLLNHLTQEQFAASIPVTYSTINRWENGHNKPSPIAIAQLEKMLLSMGDRGQELLAKYCSD